jgi:glycosyltransferase involved in cell wall biosynthesis
MPKIKSRIQNVKLVLVGDGLDRNRLMSIAAQRGLTDNIIFAGGLSYDKVHLAYAVADVFVLPTTMKERFGICLIEAMACAKPIVASRIGHVPQLVKDGFNGLLVSPNSISELYTAIMKILQQPALAKRMGLQGRALVEEKYSARQNASVLSEIYENVVR